MAWQLHYTSARRGPTGRAGFQFVAASPGLPDGVRAGVLPYLSYRPPPDAPLSPADPELALFPVSMLYDRVDGRPLLLRCRYLGRDYSGRYGNFFAHAVVADPDELEGLRPAELWQAPHWARSPEADSAVLDAVDELAPGAAVDPEVLAAWLATAGPGDPYALLGRLMDAVAGVLGRGHGRVVLVAGDVELTARWIAVVSYSLPVSAAERLTFVTYTADPEGAGQRLVGTTHAVWAAVRHRLPHAPAFDLQEGLDLHGGTPDGPVSRFARTVAGCWRDHDFAGLDALGELAPPDDPAQEGAAALLALCRGDPTVTAVQEGAAADLLSRRGSRIPEWVWRDLVPGVPSMGLELALALRERALAAGAAEVARQCSVRVTERVLAALAEAPGLGEVADAAGVTGRAGVLRRVTLTGELLRLDDLGTPPAGTAPTPARAETPRAETPRAETPRAETPRAGTRPADTAPVDTALIDAALDELWATPPSAGECTELLDAHGAAMAGRPPLATLPSRTFTRLAFPGGDGLADPAALRLAGRVAEIMPDGRAGRDAALVQAYATAITAGPERAARALERIAAADGATPRLASEAFAGSARRLRRRPPAFRAELLAALPAAARARLGDRWTAELPARARSGRAPLRGGDMEQRNDLVEVVLRLRAGGARDPGLEAWARAAAGRWLAAKQLDTRLARDPALRDALRDLLDGGPPRGER